MPNKTSDKGLENGIDYQAPLQDMAFLLNEVFPPPESVSYTHLTLPTTPYV